ncbi:unnamed protein product [Lactuca saligna]|uniref:Uncharacterized protein n=1 Tax=Lactuca saligna TaxID=75948 RepID=A0AA36E942_LACSI|nr:unnamed protein product [Lactuca saligna]
MSATPVVSPLLPSVNTKIEDSIGEEKPKSYFGTILLIQEVYDRDLFSTDDRIGDAEFDFTPFLEAMRMRLNSDILNNTIITTVKPKRTNCLAEESYITWTNGRVVQNMSNLVYSISIVTIVPINIIFCWKSIQKLSSTILFIAATNIHNYPVPEAYPTYPQHYHAPAAPPAPAPLPMVNPINHRRSLTGCIQGLQIITLHWNS